LEAEPDLTIETFIATLVFAAAFLFGGRIHPLRTIIRDRRSIVSFGAGMSAAYVFVHLIPELHGSRAALVESDFTPFGLDGSGVFFLALIGFLVFYGLEHFRSRLHESGEKKHAGSAFRLHIAGFAAYVCLMAYVLVHDVEGTRLSLAIFAVAITFHFLGVDHELHEEHGVAYWRLGRFILAGMAILGWGVAQLTMLSPTVLALLIAFISGAVIVNSALMELPSEKDGRFLPFLFGGLVYGLILLPLA
jgi:hypothetical protein